MSGVAAKFSLSSIGPGLEQLKKWASDLAAGNAFVVAGVTGAKATVPREDGEKQTVTNAQLAVIHEFGCPEKQIPARPFILASFQKHRTEYQNLLAEVLRRAVVVGVAAGLQGAKEYRRGLGIIGAKMAADMKNFVTQGPPIPPPNAPATLARKLAAGKWKRRPAPALDAFGRLADPAAEGAPRTLVNTGRLVGAITWAVHGFGSGN